MGPSSHPQPPVSLSSHSSLGYKPTNRNEKDEEKNPDHIAIDIHPTDLHQAPTALEVFHSALDMPIPKPPKPSRSFFGRKKPATNNPNAHPPLSSTNRGVYRIVLANERSMRWNYYACNAAVSIAMFLQIIVGASLTAFGAGSVDHVVITIFGVRPPSASFSPCGPYRKILTLSKIKIGSKHNDCEFTSSLEESGITEPLETGLERMAGFERVY
jgi:hypothetical protein